jgi:serine/threonine-protein kinase HipA
LGSKQPEKAPQSQQNSAVSLSIPQLHSLAIRESDQLKSATNQVGKAVSKWRDEAARHGLNKAEMDRMASAFEHEDLRAAQQGGSARA